MGAKQILRTVLVVAGLSALFLANAAWRIGASTPDELFLYWRSSDDFAIAAGYAARHEFPVAPFRVKDTIRREKDPRFVAYRERLAQELAERQIQPLTFWRTLPPSSISPDRQWRAAERFDDGGRALLLGLCYRALGGAAPFLLFWLGVLIAVPILAAIYLECRAVGHAWVGAVFITLLSCSTFVLDLLALGYSAVGFHLLALLTLVSFAIYSTLGAITTRGLVIRSLVAGCLLGVFSLARGTVPSLLPAFILALAIGLARATKVRRIAVFGLTLVLLCLPYLLLNFVVDGMVENTMTSRGRPMMPRYHDPALLIWKGLGDFDRTKGYEFRDKAGERAIIRGSQTGDASRAQEIHLRAVILSDIREEPLWFTSILVKRALSTMTLHKIWPFGPLDGTSIIKSSSPNEGVIDSYYALSAQADSLTIGPWTGEVRVQFLLLPTVALLLLAFLPVTRARLVRAVRIARGSLPILIVLSLGVLVTPVLITTATALEPQCFIVVHFLAISFLLGAVAAVAKPLPSSD